MRFGFRHPFQSASNVEKKVFRANVVKLKKLGILPGRIDAAKSTPGQIIKGPHGGSIQLQDAIRQLEPVLSGKAIPVALPPEAIKHYRKQGNEIVAFEGGKTLVLAPVSAGEKVRVEKGRIVRLPGKGLKITEIPIEFHNIDQYIKDLDKLNQEAPPNSYYGFNFFGGHSHEIFSNTSFLAKYFRDYKPRFTPEQWRKIYPQFELVTIKGDSGGSKWLSEISTSPHSKRSRPSKKKRRRRKATRK